MTNISNKTMEFEGKTLEEAIHYACEYFGSEDKSLDIQVLSKASTGIFGLGGKKCRILATFTGEKVSKPEVNDKQEEIVKKEQETVIAKTNAGNKEANEEIKTYPEEEFKEDSLEKKEIPSEGMQLKEQVDDFIEEEDDEEEIALEQLSEEEIGDYLSQMKGYVDKILELAGLDVSTAIKHDEKGAFIDISGNDIHLVIGRDGSNLDAIHYLINRIIRNKTRKNLTIRVDADGYNRKHEQRLIENAERLADRAKQTGKSMVLSPLSPKDRRIVHMHLKIIGGVRTTSIGEGIYKKIMIVPHKPKKKPDGKPYEKERGFRQPRDGQHRQSFSRDGNFNRDGNNFNRDATRDSRDSGQRPQRSSRYKKSS